MTETPHHTFRYRVLRYTPNLVRDEWVNVGVMLEQTDGPRRAIRIVEEPAEIARVRRLHPRADEALLRALPSEFDLLFRAPEPEFRLYLEKIDQTLSNVLQFSPQRGLLADDFDAELDRLFREHVAPPRAARVGVMESTRGWIRARLNDVFRRHRILGKLERSVRVEEFTEPGDPMRIDYVYRHSGARGYMQTIALGRDASQAKVLAYTAERIREIASNSEFVAITEVPPSPDNPRHRFVARLLESQNISIVPLNRVEQFAEALRPRIH